MLGPARKRQLVLVSLCALALDGCGQPGDNQSDGRVDASVERIVDGDTLVITGAGKVRLIGVDTPEVYGAAECFGTEASSFAKRLMPPGSRVSYRVGAEPRDRYGRLLAYVYVPDGRMANKVLVDAGYATPLTIAPNVEFADRFKQGARRARAAGRGLWASCGG